VYRINIDNLHTFPKVMLWRPETPFRVWYLRLLVKENTQKKWRFIFTSMTHLI